MLFEWWIIKNYDNSITKYKENRRINENKRVNSAWFRVPTTILLNLNRRVEWTKSLIKYWKTIIWRDYYLKIIKN